MILNGNKHIGYRFFVDSFAFDCQYVDMFDEFTSLNIRGKCDVKVGDRMTLVETNPKTPYIMAVGVSPFCIENLLWMYKNNRNFKRGAKFRYTGNTALDYNSVVIVDDYDFTRGMLIVRSELTNMQYLIGIREIKKV